MKREGRSGNKQIRWRALVFCGWFVLAGVSCRPANVADPETATAAPTLPTATATMGGATAVPTSTLAATTTTANETTATAAPPATYTAVPTNPPATPEPTPMPTTAVPPTPSPTPLIEVAGASLPPGFSMTRYAAMDRPTSLAFSTDGRLYATSQDGTVHLFVDEDGDGRADVDSIFFRGFNTPLGITIRPGTADVYVSSNGRISILRDRDGDLVAEEAVNFARDLPVGRHQNDNLKFGPDGLLYIGVGSTCDACVEADPRSATIMRFDPDSGVGEVYATGLRNPYDLDFHPVTGALFATDNGRDDLGLDAPQEELRTYP